MKRNLCGFTDRAAEQEQRDDVGIHTGDRNGGGGNVGEVNRAEGVVAGDDAEEETEVTHAIGDEGFLRGIGGGLLLVIVVDQHVGAETHQLPEDKNHEQIVRQHDAEHREHEDRQAAEVAGLGRVVVHVTEREHMDAQADHTDDRDHQRGEIVELDA